MVLRVDRSSVDNEATAAHGSLDRDALGAAVVCALRLRLGPDPGFNLSEAVRAGHARLLALHTVDGRPLPRDWAVPIDEDEVVVTCAPLGAPFVGIAALVVRQVALPMAACPVEGEHDPFAAAIAAALLAELENDARGR